MRPWNESQSPDDLADVARRLREERPQSSPLELDRIKTRAMARAASSGTKGFALRSRTLAVGLSLALMVGGTGGVIAGGGNGNSNGSSANGNYKPGCGPKKSDGVNPSGTHTGPPGKGDTNRTSCPKGNGSTTNKSSKSNKSSNGGTHRS